MLLPCSESFCKDAVLLFYWYMCLVGSLQLLSCSGLFWIQCINSRPSNPSKRCKLYALQPMMLLPTLTGIFWLGHQVHRTHFHAFMLDIHSRLKDHSNTQDPLLEVANDISKGCRVLALDEFFVTDVADAMVLHRLFDRLWDNGLILIATSNRAPDDLYEGGLQRDSFLPFIARLKVAYFTNNFSGLLARTHHRYCIFL